MSSRENKTKTQSIKFAAKKPITKPVEMETNSNSNSDRSGSDSEEDTKQQQQQKKQSVHSDDETTTTNNSNNNNSADDNTDTTANAADDGEENSLTPVAAHDLKKGHHVMISGQPCKVSLHKISKTGKHGHMKSRIIAYDVLTALKYEKVCPSHTTLYAPHRVLKTEYQLHYVEETDTDADSNSQSHRKGGKSHNNEQDDGIMLVLMDNNNATMSVDLPDSDLKRAVVSARQADADLEYDIFVTLLEAPVQIGGKTMIQRAISGWRKEKADN